MSRVILIGIFVYALLDAISRNDSGEDERASESKESEKVKKSDEVDESGK